MRTRNYDKAFIYRSTYQTIGYEAVSLVDSDYSIDDALTNFRRGSGEHTLVKEIPVEEAYKMKGICGSTLYDNCLIDLPYKTLTIKEFKVLPMS
jgi:hypothetical protein